MLSLRLAPLTIAAMLTWVSPNAGLGGRQPTADPPPRAAFVAVRLYALPKRVLTQCHLARAVQLCPRRLPRAWIAYRRGAIPPALTAERFAARRNGSDSEVGSASATAPPGSPTAAQAGNNTSGETDPVAFSTSNSGMRCAAGRPSPIPRGPPQSAASTAIWPPPPVPGLGVAPAMQACTSATTCGSAGNREARGSSPLCTASVTARQRRSSVGSFASYARSAPFHIRSSSRAGHFSNQLPRGTFPNTGA